jgi:hypothetical protein
MEKHTVSRRAVLGGAAAAAGATAAGLWNGVEVSPAGASAFSQPSPQLRQAQFVPLIGKPVTVQGAGVHTSVTLTAVRPLAMTGLPRTAPNKIRTTGQQFSLDFTGSPASAFPQGVYTLSAPTLGSFSLLVVPIGPPSGSRQYQAIIVSV